MWFTPQHRAQLQADGYAAVRGVVPRELASRAAREIAGFVGANLDDPSSWYGPHLVNRGFIPVHHAQVLWDVRQHPNLHAVYSEIHGTHKLLVDINRCAFHPPRHRRWPQAGRGEIHWDVDPRDRGRAGIQGAVLLSDVRKGGGGYQCRPDIYRRADRWLDKHARSDTFDFFNPGLTFWRAVEVEGQAGDLIVWNSRLPHGPAPNRSQRPRIVQFVSMGKIGDDAARLKKIADWYHEKRAPEIWRGLPYQQDPEPGPPARLTSLGRRLIGLDPWPDDPEAATARD